MERAEGSGQEREKKEAVEVVQESYSYSEESDVEGSSAESDLRRSATRPPFETAVNLPTPKGYRLTGEKEESEKRPGYLVRTITQTFTRI